MSTSIWVVTREINEYNQDGEYFVAAYMGKPDFKELKILLPEESDPTIGKLLRGGGRQKWENEWFILREYEKEERCQHEMVL